MNHESQIVIEDFALAPEPPQYYIPAPASMADANPRTLKHGNTFAVLDHYGDIGDSENGPEGVYYEDTRHLSRLKLLFEGHRLLLLSSTMRDDNASLTVDLSNPDMYRDGHIVFPHEKLHIIRTKFLWQAGCYERLGIRNFDSVPHRVRMSFSFAADFADLFEVRGEKRERRGLTRIERQGNDTVVLRYQGLDQRERVTRLTFSPVPKRLTTGEATFELDLAPGAREQIFVTVHCDERRPVRRGEFFVAMREARHAQRIGSKDFALIETSNEILNLILCRSMSDLSMLITDTPQGPYPYAGIPWFSTAFGRDGIITALELLWIDPRVAKGVLRYLAATQATEEDPAAAAQPGKILHETRQGEMARLGEVPFRLYYGTVDATPLFVLLAGRYFERTGDRATMIELWPHIEAALHWIDTYGDADGDGFVEYFAEDGKGLRNQGWKDSADSIMHADGTLIEGSVALVEVQAYVHAAKRSAAAIARALGKPGFAEQLEREADRLRSAFEAAFWCEDLGIYALALDGDKRPCRVRSSNAGHALFGGIATPDHAARTAETLMGRDLYSGWGIRTLGASEARYNPMSYHNGSVWPHDNALIALGFARYGLKDAAQKVFTGMFGAIQYMDLHRPPELFCGFNRRRSKAPTLYPVACSPQAWAAGAPLAFLEASLGLHCDAARRELRFNRPALPGFVDTVHLSRMQLGDARVDLLASRHAADVAINVLNRHGEVRVVTES